MSDERDYKQELYEAYKAERKDLNGTALTISDRYDKNVLYIGAGALAVSLTFLEKIAPRPEGWLVSLLIAAWACLVTSILTHLTALAYGQRAIRQQMEYLEEDYTKFLNSETPEIEVASTTSRKNKYSKKTGFFSELSLYLVVFGVGFLCAFSVVSIINKNRSSNVRQTKAAVTTTTVTTTTTTTTETTNSRDSGVVHSSGKLDPATSPAKEEDLKNPLPSTAGPLGEVKQPPGEELNSPKR